jgi:ubiquinone/menaquinone biosynthesis C-methylase UbiE
LSGPTKLVLPPRGALPKTNDEDPVDYYYRPLTAALYRGRLKLAARLLGQGPFDALLDVGYGSGIFMPELARRAARVVGLEVHTEAAAVAQGLRRLGVDAELHTGDLFSMPFEDGVFDALVCLSVLEHLTELDDALAEFRRVLRPGGVAVLCFPTRNPLTDRFFRLAGFDPRALHPSGHLDILAAARRQSAFAVEREAHFPALVPLALSGYAGCRCRAL